MRSLTFLMILFLAATPALASYRVYYLQLTYYNAKGKVVKVDRVFSSLDQAQYEHYYGGYRWIAVKTLDTWYCPGDTGAFRKFCSKPKIVERGLSSLDHPKRNEIPYTRQPVIP
jgi:hypothetical protein